MTSISVIISIIISSLIKILGFPLQVFAITYFSTKPSLNKTAFDSIIVDTILAGILGSAFAFLGFCLIVLQVKLSFFSLVLISSAAYVSIQFLLDSVSVLCLTKFLYLKYSQYLLESDDKVVRKWSWIAKVSMSIVFLMLCQAGPMDQDIATFEGLDVDDEYQGLSYLKQGFGIPLNGLITVSSLVVVHRLAKKMCPENEENEKSVRSLVILALIPAGCFLFNLIAVKESLMSLPTLLTFFFPVWLTLSDIVIPAFLALRHRGLKTFIQEKIGLANLPYSVDQ